jgi:hypothetical protein
MTRFSREPLRQSPPTPAGPPTSIPAGGECSILPSLRAAYFSLLAGNQTAQTRDGERWQTWQRGDAKTLQIEIRRLEQICEESSRHGRSIRAGGIRKPWYGLNGYGYPYYGGNW